MSNPTNRMPTRTLFVGLPSRTLPVDLVGPVLMIGTGPSQLPHELPALRFPRNSADAFEQPLKFRFLAYGLENCVLGQLVRIRVSPLDGKIQVPERLRSIPR